MAQIEASGEIRPEGIVGLSAVARAALETMNAGRAAMAGRVIHIEGFSTWAGDELIVVDDAGAQHGWVLGDVGARRVKEAVGGSPVAGLTTVTVDVHGADVEAAGLSCGGRAELLLQPLADIPGELWSRLASRAPVALLTRVDGPAAGPAAAVVAPDGTTFGTLAGAPSGVDAAVAEARQLLANGHSATRRVEDEAGTILVEAWIPDPRLVVVGTGDLIGAIAAQARLLGWDTRAVEDRPDAESESWPSYDQAVAWAGASGAVIVLSHDPHVDVAALGTAIDRGVPYIGAMGSRRTQSRRLERLVKLGRNEAELEQIHRPIGLDLGGRSAPEVALAICAEILAVHCGRDARPLRDSDGPINDRPTR
ncbi:MAG TPA: XdhC family protein [Acidimicrobiales bacterium]|nr:XdhC family protein [Acidimicrobiales bacterium]